MQRDSLYPCAVMLVLCASTQALPPSPKCGWQIVSYFAGTGAGASYQNPAAALGPPTLTTGAGVDPGAVTPFRPAFMPAEIVSIGRGGWLIIEFETPIYDDPRNAFGVDFIVYGNSFFGDLAYPGGVAGLHFQEGGSIQVSADGQTWIAVSGEADGGLPTMAFLDAGPYQTFAGDIPADPAIAVDPAITPDTLIGLEYSQLQDAYGGGCGGTRVDLASAGVPFARFVRISVSVNAPLVPEIDAVVAVRHEGAPADLNADGVVDGADLGILLGAWGSASHADLDGSGAVDGADLGALLGGWST